jgi:hypothetical protein
MHKTVQQIGGALGTALIATIYFTIVPGQGAQQVPTAFLAVTAIVALDLVVVAMLLGRLPERLFTQ